MKKRHLILAILAVILVLSVSIGPTIAYFTTYARGNGGYVIHLGHKTVIEDDIEGSIKHVSIFNKADGDEDVGKYPLFIRAKVFYGSDCIVTFQDSANWTPEGDYYYYELPIYAALTPDATSTTSTLYLKVDPNPDADIEVGDEIDVLVTYQSVPAVFDESGLVPLRAQSWANQADIKDINA